MKALLLFTLLSVQLCYGQSVNDLMKYSIMEFDTAVEKLSKGSEKQDTSMLGITFSHQHRTTTITQSDIGNNNILTSVTDKPETYWSNMQYVFLDNQFKLAHVDDTDFGKLYTYESVFCIVSLGMNEKEKLFVTIVLVK